MTVDRNIVLGKRKGLTFRHAYLLAHEVFADDFFGNRMFDLQASIDLKKIEVIVITQQKLHRTR